MRILAIDPGYDRLGVAVVEGDPSRPTLVTSDCITPDKGVREKRLAHVSCAITETMLSKNIRTTNMLSVFIVFLRFVFERELRLFPESCSAPF